MAGMKKSQEGFSLQNGKKTLLPVSHITLSCAVACLALSWYTFTHIVNNGLSVKMSSLGLLTSLTSF